MLTELYDRWTQISLIKRIIGGLVVGIIAAFVAPVNLHFITIFGDLFVNSLKAVAPLLVFFLVMSSLSKQEQSQPTNIRIILVLYIVGTLAAAVTSVVISYFYNVKLVLAESAQGLNPPGGIADVISNIALKVVGNPIQSICEANYIGILFWAVVFGVALRHASESTHSFLTDFSNAISAAVRFVIQFAPLGVMGLVFSSIVNTGAESLLVYAQVAVQLVTVMLIVALVVNPLIAWILMQKNPYPLVFTCLRDSGITAFFTRSSAANIPVNMALCKKLDLDVNTYSVSIPLGATVNMAGAAVTISTLTLSAVHALNINVDIPEAILLSVMAAISACGASGVAGGSLLLIPLACSLFGISNDIAMQVVGIGFVVGVIQDSCETALNSSTDVLFTAIADKKYRKHGFFAGADVSVNELMHAHSETTAQASTQGNTSESAQTLAQEPAQESTSESEQA